MKGGSLPSSHSLGGFAVGEGFAVATFVASLVSFSTRLASFLAALLVAIVRDRWNDLSMTRALSFREKPESL